MLDKLLDNVVHVPTEKEEAEFLDWVNSLFIYEHKEKPSCYYIHQEEHCYRFAEDRLAHSPIGWYNVNGYKVLTFKEFKEQYMEVKEKEIRITIPTGYVIDEENSTFECIKFKPKKLTYEDIAEELFEGKQVYYINDNGKIEESTCYRNCGTYADPNNCVTKTQAEKLLAINKLMNVAAYLNGKDWDFYDNTNAKYAFYIDTDKKLGRTTSYLAKFGSVYFRTRELAEKAIEILGEETIKLALS